MPTPTVGSYIGQVDIDGNTIHKIGSTLYGTCATASSTAAKVVVCPGFEEFITGVTIHVKFDNSNSASNATLNVNSTGAKPLCKYGTTRVDSKINLSWPAGSVVSFTYDGTSWVMNDRIDDSRVKQMNAGSANNSSYPVLLSAITNTYYDTHTGEVLGSTKVSANPNTGAFEAVTVNGYTLGAACAKAIGSVASGNTGLVTGGDVYTAIQSAAAGSLQYQGTATSNSDIGTSYHAGWYWIVGSTGGTIAGQTVEAGDMILAHADYSGTLTDDLDIVQSNVDRITNSDIDTIVAA